MATLLQQFIDIVHLNGCGYVTATQFGKALWNKSSKKKGVGRERAKTLIQKHPESFLAIVGTRVYRVIPASTKVERKKVGCPKGTKRKITP